MQYTAKITQKGQITIPAELRKLKNWTNGSHLVFSINDKNEVEVHKKVNLYDTEWGNYDFQKAVHDDPELQLGDYDQGREGWPKDNE